MDNIKFKGIDVSIKITELDFKKYMKKIEEKRNTKYDVIKDGDIDLTILNTNLSTTTLTRYHYKNSKGETIFVIEQADAQGDDVTFTFYLSDKKIADDDVTNLIKTFDDIVNKI